MPVDLDSAERFVLANARLLDRHRPGVGAVTLRALAALATHGRLELPPAAK